jgi:hypothetical protein
MTAPGPQRVQHGGIAFADIVDSTALYERLGDAAAKAAVESCLLLVREQAELHAGHVVKHLGDGLLCSFDSASDAMLAAVGMCVENQQRGLPIRVGVNWGARIEDRGDVFGDAVNTAARMAALAKPFEVMFSAAISDALPPELEGLVRPVPPVSVKGKREPLALSCILIEPGLDDASSVTTFHGGSSQFRSFARSAARLVLTYSGETFTVEPGSELDIGRDASCGIVVSSRWASRLHARVFMRPPRFLLADQSANGTFLVTPGSLKLHLLRENAPLFDAGRIYIGEDPDRGDPEPILFRVER